MTAGTDILLNLMRMPSGGEIASEFLFTGFWIECVEALELDGFDTGDLAVG